MLPFSDEPYRYFPPRRFAPTAWVLTQLNRLHYLPRVKRICAVEVTGADALLRMKRRGDGILFTPNHPTHADPQIYVEALRQIGQTAYIMAAYDVFLRRRRDAWVMKRLGCFSVDREGSDAKAMTQASTILRDGRRPLTIFPEGNVYLLNDLVTPFHDGAAMLALRAAKELAKASRRVLVVPVSIKASYTEDVRENVRRLLGTVASAVECQIDEQFDMPNQLKQVGLTALRRNLRHRGIEVDDWLELSALIETAGGRVLEQLEAKIQIKPKPKDSLIDRVRQARRTIHQVRTDSDRPADQEAAATWADQAMLAFRIASYRGDYVRSNPTIDRIAETVQKLAEDVLSQEARPLGARRAFVRFGEPIDTGEHLESFQQKARVAVRALTEQVETRVQEGIDECNRTNACMGGEYWHPGV